MHAQGLSRTAPAGKTPVLTPHSLRQQNQVFQGSGGVSAANRSSGFSPAFLDTETGIIYLSRFTNGRQAPMHLLDGLPDEVVVARRESGAVSAVKPTVTAGFWRRRRFFTREQAARALRLADRIQAHLAARQLQVNHITP